MTNSPATVSAQLPNGYSFTSHQDDTDIVITIFSGGDAKLIHTEIRLSGGFADIAASAALVAIIDQTRA